MTFRFISTSVWAAGCLLLTMELSAQTLELELDVEDNALTDNIRSHVRLNNLSCDAPEARVTLALPRVRQQIVRAGRALGYYRLRQSVSAREDQNCWVISAEVEAGEPVIVTAVDVEITNNQALFASVTENLALRAGQQLNQANYELVKGQLNTTAVEQGFFDARIQDSALELDLENNTASASVRFDPGERYRFGEFRIQNLSALNNEFITSYIDVEPGDFFTSSALLSVRNALNESLYFQRVSVSPLHDEAQGQSIPIDIELQMRPRHAFTLGGGVTTNIGPRIRADFENRYLTPDGHRFAINSSLSPVQRQLDFSYQIPLARPRTEWLEFALGHLGEDVDTFNAETSKLSGKYTFVDSFGWRRDYSLTFQHDISQLNDEPRERTDMLIPALSFSRTQADDTLYPTRGWRLFAQLSAAHDSLLSSESFLQLNAFAKFILPLGPGRVLLRAEVGSTAVDNVLELPVSLQYFTGGDQSVRGYKYQSLGPLNAEQEVVGGKHLIVGSVEYDFSIMDDWKLAVFVDGGNAFNDSSELDFKTGAGLGVRWLSPIGPIRLDLAAALDDGKDFRIHLTMGPDL